MMRDTSACPNDDITVEGSKNNIKAKVKAILGIPSPSSRSGRAEPSSLYFYSRSFNASKKRFFLRCPSQAAFCTLQDNNQSFNTSEQYRRVNGFKLPFHLYQVFSWFLFLVDIMLFYSIVIPSISFISRIVFSVVFAFVTVAVFVTAALTTAVNPADILALKKDKKDSCQIISLHNNCLRKDKTNSAYCDLCGVIDYRSKHCKACNKCIYVFDHHCKWLNNCIGCKNYKYFLLLIISVGVLTLIILGLCIWIIVAEAVFNEVETKWIEVYAYWSTSLFYTFCSIFILINVPLFVLDIQLIAFHLYLLKEGITTYEYITRRINDSGDLDLKQEEALNKTKEDKVGIEVCAVAEKKDTSFNEKKRCCAEWIVLDKKRLKRARDRLVIVKKQAKTENSHVKAKELDYVQNLGNDSESFSYNENNA